MNYKQALRVRIANIGHIQSRGNVNSIQKNPNIHRLAIVINFFIQPVSARESQILWLRHLQKHETERYDFSLFRLHRLLFFPVSLFLYMNVARECLICI